MLIPLLSYNKHATERVQSTMATEMWDLVRKELMKLLKTILRFRPFFKGLDKNVRFYEGKYLEKFHRLVQICKECNPILNLPH